MIQRRLKIGSFQDLSWDDLEGWAGATVVSRARSYQRSGQVHGLARTPSGGAVAWVQGTHRYATVVEAKDGELISSCTCPYAGTCKHAVAVVLDYLEHLKQKREVPIATEQDPRLRSLRAIKEEEATWDEEDEEEEWDEDTVHPFSSRSKKAAADTLSAFLEKQTKEQLIALLKEQAERHPAVRQALQDRIDLSAGAVKELVDAVREEIDELSGEPDWEDDWGGGGSGSDYARLLDRLQALLVAGHADRVIELGQELLEAGTRRVEMADDEGETAEEIASCMDLVFEALSHSSLSPAEQMLWTIDAELDDEYDLCRGAGSFWKQEHAPADWNSVADELGQRLKQYTSIAGEESSSRNYHRNRLSDWLIKALEKAGRQEEIIPLCEREAEETGSYMRLVNRLKGAGRWGEAEQWIYRGIEATQKRWSGIANELRTALRELREREKDWLRVAAFYAEDFFQQPTLHTFRTLQKASERAGVWPTVQAAAMHYLETGERPQTTERMKKDQVISPWPLPETGLPVSAERRQMSPPMTDTLIDIAIADQRPAEVIRWYDERKPRSVGWIDDDKIAQAVADAYPDRALAIWKKRAEAQIALTDTRAYETAAGYLRKVYRLLTKLERREEWKGYLSELRRSNARKRRLLEILDRLEDRRIIDQ
ncbi:MAG TPA: SWIM zinc finger family protein [Gammaproteobacteria bacterium]|nr:SWIM zinc finger family protein [Gammaproteobacteria bacterium]